MFLLCILTVSGTAWVAPANAAVVNPYKTLSNVVEHTMTIRVALVGMSQIDQDQLRWNLEPEISPNVQVANQVGLSDLTYGTKFKINYEFISVSQETTSALESYLQSIAQTKKVPAYLRNKDTGVYSCWYWWQSDSNSYMTIDALKTEEWINSHISDFGGIPDDGYLILAADLSGISKLHHYYEHTYYDLDPGVAQAKYYSKPAIWPLVNWMFTWGGHHRFYFMDLSAGDPRFDYSGICHVPIQDLDERPYWGKVKFKKDTQTVTEYVADYLAEATRNLFLPSYVYTPTYATSFKIAIHVFDDTGKVTQANIGDYLSTSKVKDAFADVIPYATWDVSASIHRLEEDDGLAEAFRNNILCKEEGTGTFGDRIFINYYDYRPIYSYLQSHLTEYVDITGDSVVLPVFEFVLSSSSRFAYTWREEIGQPSRGPDGVDRTFGGISLGDLIIIGQSERSLFAFGYGLTYVTIHELGHAIGIMHPHSYGWTEDYVSSAMSYLTYEYGFSQFDLDAIQRGHADFFLSQVQGPIEISAEATLHQQAQSLVQQASSVYKDALSSYSKKDYMQAVKSLQSVSQTLDQAFETEQKTIQDQLTQAAVTSDPGKAFAERANSLLDSAMQAKAAGNIGAAYQLLASASMAGEDALQAENQAQAYAQLQEEKQSLLSELQKTQSMLPIYAIISLVVGMAVGCALMWVVLRRKKTPPPPS